MINKTLTLPRRAVREGCANAPGTVNSSMTTDGAARFESTQGVILDGFTVQGETSTSDLYGAGPRVMAADRVWPQLLNNIVKNITCGVRLTSRTARSSDPFFSRSLTVGVQSLQDTNNNGATADAGSTQRNAHNGFLTMSH